MASFNLFLVSVAYEVPTPLGNQFNLPAVQKSFEFVVKTANELGSNVLVQFATESVKKVGGEGNATKFRVASVSPINAKFFKKDEGPAKLDLYSAPVPAPEGEEIVE